MVAMVTKQHPSPEFKIFGHRISIDGTKTLILASIIPNIGSIFLLVMMLQLLLLYEYSASIQHVNFVHFQIFLGWKVDVAMMMVFKQCWPRMDRLQTIK